MKICYIWAERFKNLSNFSLNISSDKKFKYTSQSNNLIKIKFEALPKNFFGENILDVVGIIGKNGSGKSNAIEFVCKILKSSPNSFKSNYIIIVEELNKLICHYSLPNGLAPTVDFEITLIEHKNTINPLKIIFFSNVFDGRKSDFNSEISDISVNNTYNRPIYTKKKYTSDFEKQIYFIDSTEFPLLKIELPSKVQFTSKTWMHKNSSMERDLYGDNYAALSQFKRKIRSRLQDIKPDNKFIYTLKLGYFFQFIKYNITNNTIHSGIIKKRLLNLILEINSTEFKRTDNLIDEIIIFLHETINLLATERIISQQKNNPTDSFTYAEKINKQINFLHAINKLPAELNIEYFANEFRGEAVYDFTLDYTSKASKNFINEYIALFGENFIFDTNWIGISSGHKAYLNLFSSIHHELKYTRQNNLLLCIDEGDLYLHPAWQVEFLDKLLTIIPKIFNGKTQILITSHSPFLLSDLPNQSLTILDSTSNELSIDGINLKTKTFGGNLYKLYAEPFFLGKQRTSMFAHKKIINVIKYAESSNLNSAQKNDILEMLEIIGDEVIKFRIGEIIKND